MEDLIGLEDYSKRVNEIMLELSAAGEYDETMNHRLSNMQTMELQSQAMLIATNTEIAHQLARLCDILSER